MSQPQVRCLILACGNTLRSDDGVGLWLAAWAERRFADQPGVRIIACQQWTPELAEEVAHAHSVLFIDCSVDSAPGSLSLSSVEPAAGTQGLATHHLGAAELLALGRDLYASLPSNAKLLTIGAGSTELGEAFSDPVTAALPAACKRIDESIFNLFE
ncbi:MAG: hydrogenase maturation protease [Terracidiphilus sp.]|jgi:hydrogenase maturation protease